MILCMTEVSECRSNDAVFGKEEEGITGIRTSRWIELDTVCIHIDSKWSGAVTPVRNRGMTVTHAARYWAVHVFIRLALVLTFQHVTSPGSPLYFVRTTL
jgi:hypothetical protein